MRGALAHPVHLGAVALLLINDQVLKYLWPGTVTGKLSDFAGVFVVAVVAGVLLKHRGVALAATGIGFIAIKTSSAAAALVAPVLGGVTLQDSSDLIALAALVPAAYHLGRFKRHELGRVGGVEHGETGSGSSDHAQGLLRLAVGVSAAATVLTVTATSCLPWAQVQGFRLQSDGIVAVGFEEEHLSVDGGRTWEPIGRPEEPITQQTEACLADGRCFRVVEETAVEELIDGDWQTSFAYDDEQLEAIQYTTDQCSGRLSIQQTFQSIVVVPESAAGADSEVVLVAMASHGVLRLDPNADTWSRVAVGEAEPPDFVAPPPRALAIAVFGAPFLLIALSPFMLLIRFRTASLGRRFTALAIALIGGGALAVSLFVFTFAAVGPEQFSAGRIIAVLTLVVGAIALWVVLSGKPRQHVPAAPGPPPQSPPPASPPPASPPPASPPPASPPPHSPPQSDASS